MPPRRCVVTSAVDRCASCAERVRNRSASSAPTGTAAGSALPPSMGVAVPPRHSKPCLLKALSQARARSRPWARQPAPWPWGPDDALGERIQRTLIIAKDGHLQDGVNALPGVEVIESSHPMARFSARSAPGQRLCEFVAQVPAQSLPVFLVSGGASSLAEVLVPGASLLELRQLNAAGPRQRRGHCGVECAAAPDLPAQGRGPDGLPPGPYGSGAVRLGCSR